MDDETDPAARSPAACTLRWITAALLLSGIVVGIVVPNLEVGPPQDSLCDLHRSIGAVIVP